MINSQLVDTGSLMEDAVKIIPFKEYYFATFQVERFTIYSGSKFINVLLDENPIQVLVEWNKEYEGKERYTLMFYRSTTKEIYEKYSEVFE